MKLTNDESRIFDKYIVESDEFAELCAAIETEDNGEFIAERLATLAVRIVQDEINSNVKINRIQIN